MKTNLLNKTLFAAAAVALTTVSFNASASAQDRTVRTAEVSFADLDLTSDKGKATLQGRIKGAVRKVCSSYDRLNLREVMDQKNCVQESYFSARQGMVSLIAAAEAGEPVQTAMVIRK